MEAKDCRNLSPSLNNRYKNSPLDNGQIHCHGDKGFGRLELKHGHVSLNHSEKRRTVSADSKNRLGSVESRKSISSSAESKYRIQATSAESKNRHASSVESKNSQTLSSESKYRHASYVGSKNSQTLSSESKYRHASSIGSENSLKLSAESKYRNPSPSQSMHNRKEDASLEFQNSREPTCFKKSAAHSRDFKQVRSPSETQVMKEIHMGDKSFEKKQFKQKTKSVDGIQQQNRIIQQNKSIIDSSPSNNYSKVQRKQKSEERDQGRIAKVNPLQGCIQQTDLQTGCSLISSDEDDISSQEDLNLDENEDDHITLIGETSPVVVRQQTNTSKRCNTRTFGRMPAFSIKGMSTPERNFDVSLLPKQKIAKSNFIVPTKPKPVFGFDNTQTEFNNDVRASQNFLRRTTQRNFHFVNDTNEVLKNEQDERISVANEQELPQQREFDRFVDRASLRIDRKYKNVRKAVTQQHSPNCFSPNQQFESMKHVLSDEGNTPTRVSAAKKHRKESNEKRYSKMNDRLKSPLKTEKFLRKLADYSFSEKNHSLEVFEERSMEEMVSKINCEEDSSQLKKIKLDKLCTPPKLYTKGKDTKIYGHDMDLDESPGLIKLISPYTENTHRGGRISENLQPENRRNVAQNELTIYRSEESPSRSSNNQLRIKSKLLGSNNINSKSSKYMETASDTHSPHLICSIKSNPSELSFKESAIVQRIHSKNRNRDENEHHKRTKVVKNNNERLKYLMNAITSAQADVEDDLNEKDEHGEMEAARVRKIKTTTKTRDITKNQMNMKEAYNQEKTKLLIGSNETNSKSNDQLQDHLDLEEMDVSYCYQVKRKSDSEMYQDTQTYGGKVLEIYSPDTHQTQSISANEESDNSEVSQQSGFDFNHRQEKDKQMKKFFSRSLGQSATDKAHQNIPGNHKKSMDGHSEKRISKEVGLIRKLPQSNEAKVYHEVEGEYGRKLSVQKSSNMNATERQIIRPRLKVIPQSRNAKKRLYFTKALVPLYSKRSNKVKTSGACNSKSDTNLQTAEHDTNIANSQSLDYNGKHKQKRSNTSSESHTNISNKKRRTDSACNLEPSVGKSFASQYTITPYSTSNKNQNKLIPGDDVDQISHSPERRFLHYKSDDSSDSEVCLL